MNSIVNIEAGANHTTAVKSDGTVWTLWHNWYWQFGNGFTTYDWDFNRTSTAIDYGSMKAKEFNIGQCDPIVSTPTTIGWICTLNSSNIECNLN